MNDTIEQLVRDVPRLNAALTMREKTIAPTGMVTGGTPSWELISLAVDAVLRDLRRECDEWEQLLRMWVGHRWHRSPELPDALRALAVAWQAYVDSGGETTMARECERDLSVVAHRARVVLGEAWQPYELLWPNGERVVCPVVEWHSGGASHCLGQLWVHRDDRTGVPSDIRCRRAREHVWRSGPEWLRLGALLGVA